MAQVQARSTFVTLVGSIFIVLSSFGTLISILQNIMAFTVFQSPELRQVMESPQPGVPPVAAFMTSHFHLFTLAFLLVSVLTLVSAIGLLKRLNWARLCFIGIMALAVLWSLLSLVLQWMMSSFMLGQFAAASGENGIDMRPFFLAVTVMSAVFSLGFGVLFGWIAKRLLSPEVVAEFSS